MTDINIFGQKGGGGSSHTATEDANTLQSNSVARIIDVISEGPCIGIVDGKKSIYLNSTPIESSDGTINFNGVDIEQRYGLPSQSFVPGFPASENEIGVSVQIKETTPLVRTVSNVEANACRVTLATPQLISTDKSTGDIHGSSVEVAIDIQAGSGAWREMLRDTISGKTTSTYQRSYRVELDGTGPWNVRVRRITPDSTDSSVSNTVEWSSYAEIVDGKFSYPDVAYAAVKFDAQAFGGSIPSRAYDFKGLIISVPSNYNPDTREYSGIWDGSFKQAWTDNPAWIFYDLLTNARYGMGLTDVDRYGLYTIAKYCDELVPDGYGGKEPRFTLNTVINSREEAYAVLNNIAGAFRGMFYWAGDTVTAVQDAPRTEDGARAFGPANVVDGKFSYTSSSDVARHTVANVTWNDPAQQYAQTVETVEDPDSIQKYGWNQTDITAFGCTSRGQSRRLGLWTLYTEREETQTVKFSVSVADADLRPGQVIAVSDPSFAGARLLGRIKGYDAGSMAVTLDQAPEKVEGQQWKITLRMPDGSTATRDCTLSGNVATLSQSLPEAPVDSAWWMLSSSKIGPQYYRVMSLADNDDGTFAIDAVEHHPTKYEQVEQGVYLEEVPASLIPTGAIAAPGAITAKSYTSTSGTQLVQCMTISWERSSDARVQSYVVSAKGPNDSAFRDVGSTGTVSLDMRDVAPGEWRIRVRALDGFGQSSAWSSLVTTIGNMLMPVKPSRVDVNTGNRAASLSAYADGVSSFGQEYEFWMSRAELGKGQIESNANLVAQGTSIAVTGLTADTTYWFYVRGINNHGVSDWYPAQAKTTNDFTEEYEYTKQQLERPGGVIEQINNSVKDTAAGAARDVVPGAVGNAMEAIKKDTITPLSEKVDKQATSFADFQESTKNDHLVQNEQIRLAAAAAKIAQSSVSTEQSARITADEALGQRIDLTTAKFEQVDAQVSTEERARASADDALSDRITKVQASADKANSAVQDEATARANADTALAARVTEVRSDLEGDVAGVKDSVSAISRKADDASNTASATAEANRRLESSVNDKVGRIDTQMSTYADDQLVQNVQLALNSAANATAAASVRTEGSSRVTNDYGLAQQITVVSATVDDLNATVKTEMKAEVDRLTGLLNAQYTLSATTSNGRPVAIGMKTNGKESELVFMANRVAIADDATGSLEYPFVVQNGRVMMKSAMIGTGVIGGTLQSASFGTGQPGWRLNQNGSLEGTGVKVSGDIEATSFRAVSSRSGYRTEQDERGGRVYDPNNRLRVRWGTWD